jgi:hypothetical protein
MKKEIAFFVVLIMCTGLSIWYADYQLKKEKEMEKSHKKESNFNNFKF